MRRTFVCTTWTCFESGVAKEVTLIHLGQGLYQAPVVICGACGSQVRDVNLSVKTPKGEAPAPAGAERSSVDLGMSR